MKFKINKFGKFNGLMINTSHYLQFEQMKAKFLFIVIIEINLKNNLNNNFKIKLKLNGI